MKQTVRYIFAVVFGCIAGEVVGVALAFAIDIVLGEAVTGGRWALNAPNALLVICKGLVMGYTAGAIAGRRGKLLGAVTAFFPLAALITLSIALNSDILGRFAENLDTKPALWAWLALLPAIIGGQIGAKNGSGGLQVAIAGAGWLATVGFYFAAAAFHVYTIIVAYLEAGFGAALLSASTPPIAEFYWAVRIWRTAGYITNQYDMVFLLLACLMILGIGMVGIATALERRADGA